MTLANPAARIDTFIFVSDPGHGWLLISKDQLKDVGLTEGDITPFSYQNGDVLALEEDCDAQTFAEAWTAKYGRPIAVRERHEDPTKIRDWRGFGRKP